MGLGDEYFRRPYAPAQDANEAMARGFSQLPDLEKRKMEMERARLENERMRQDLPDNPATPHGTNMGNHVKTMLENTPGHQPGFADRLLQEHAQGGLGAPSYGPSPDGLPTQNMGQQRYAPGPQGPQPFANPVRPVGPPQASMPDMTSSGGLGAAPQGFPAPPPETPQPAQPQVQAPQVAQAQPPQAAPPQDLGPMTNRDVGMYMHMAPFLKQQKEDQKLTIAREQMAARQKIADQNDKLRRDLARLSAAYRQSPDDKLLIAKLHEAANNHRAAMGDLAKMDSGLRGVIDDAGVEAQTTAERRADAAAQQDYEAALDEAKGRGRGTRKSGSASGSASSMVKVRGPDGQTQDLPDTPKLRDWLKANSSSGYNLVVGGK